MPKKQDKMDDKNVFKLVDSDVYMCFSEFLERFSSLYEQRLKSEEKSSIPETIIIDNNTGKIIL